MVGCGRARWRRRACLAIAEVECPLVRVLSREQIMTWEEMITTLQNSGVPAGNLPVRGKEESCYGLHRDGDRFIVNLTERGGTEYIAEFPNEELAVAFIYDTEVISHKINGDTRFDKFNVDPQAFPLPRAEKFGGRTLQT